MDDIVNIILDTYIIGFNQSYIGNGTGDILTVYLRSASGGYPLFHKLYSFCGCHYW